MDSTLEALDYVFTYLKRVGGVKASAAASRDRLLMKALNDAYGAICTDFCGNVDYHAGCNRDCYYRVR
ncbi:MAG: hypothetical protein C5S40_04540 [ANME-2 cluster archaeon]|nr:hypothetical protein [ANME-2 cluster archaeon]